jgi:hypothetical protein
MQGPEFKPREGGKERGRQGRREGKREGRKEDEGLAVQLSGRALV